MKCSISSTHLADLSPVDKTGGIRRGRRNWYEESCIETASIHGIGRRSHGRRICRDAGLDRDRVLEARLPRSARTPKRRSPTSAPRWEADATCVDRHGPRTDFRLRSRPTAIKRVQRSLRRAGVLVALRGRPRVGFASATGSLEVSYSTAIHFPAVGPNNDRRVRRISS